MTDPTSGPSCRGIPGQLSRRDSETGENSYHNGCKTGLWKCRFATESLARTSYGRAAPNFCRSGELQLGLSCGHVKLKTPGWRAKASLPASDNLHFCSTQPRSGGEALPFATPRRFTSTRCQIRSCCSPLCACRLPHQGRRTRRSLQARASDHLHLAHRLQTVDGRLRQGIHVILRMFLISTQIARWRESVSWQSGSASMRRRKHLANR